MSFSISYQFINTLISSNISVTLGCRLPRKTMSVGKGMHILHGITVILSCTACDVPCGSLTVSSLESLQDPPSLKHPLPGLLAHPAPICSVAVYGPLQEFSHVTQQPKTWNIYIYIGFMWSTRSHCKKIQALATTTSIIQQEIIFTHSEQHIYQSKLTLSLF